MYVFLQLGTNLLIYNRWDKVETKKDLYYHGHHNRGEKKLLALSSSNPFQTVKMYSSHFFVFELTHDLHNPKKIAS